MDHSQIFVSPAVKTLARLHEKHLLLFFNTWQKCKSTNLLLPKTSDLDYNSMDTLLHHVINSSKNYLIWICKNVNIDYSNVSSEMFLNPNELYTQKFIDKLTLLWKNSLTKLTSSDMEKVFISNWDVKYSIEAMLEHAVMHCIRHEYQLRNLLKLKSE